MIGRAGGDGVQGLGGVAIAGGVFARSALRIGRAGSRPDAWAERPLRESAPPALLLLLNLLDAVFTLTYLQLGLAEELNPLMRSAYEVSPLLFMVLKLVMVHLGVGLLWAHRRARPARVALWAAIFLYAAIVAYHLSYLSLLGAPRSI